jgi:hypothetical protein
MRLLRFLVSTVSASNNWLDFSNFFTGDHSWDTELEQELEIDDGDLITQTDLVQPHGRLVEVPSKCTRPVLISSDAEYGASIREILLNRTVQSISAMLRSQGVESTDPRYDSLRYAFRKFREGIEVSEPELRAMLEMNERGSVITETLFQDTLRSRGLLQGRRINRRCPLMIWFFHVINPVRTTDHLEISRFSDDNGVVMYRPNGDALVRLVNFELDRIKRKHSKAR